MRFPYILAFLFLVPAGAQEPLTQNWDCLSGACLNQAMPSALPPEVVRVSGEKMLRTVEVCSGRVVEVTLTRSWIQSDRSYENGAQEFLLYGAYMQESERFLLRVLSAHTVDLGWECEPEREWSRCSKLGVQGTRRVTFKQEDAASFWKERQLIVSTLHPDTEALCQHRRVEGL